MLADFQVWGPFIDGAGRSYCAGVIRQEIKPSIASSIRTYLETKVHPANCKPAENGILGSELLKVIEITDSIGGDLNAAVAIVELMQRYDIAVETWDRGPKYSKFKCASACALIFAGAPRRHYIVGQNDGSVFPPFSSKFGLHKPEFIVPNNVFKDEVAKEKEYDRLKYRLIELYKKVGVKPQFVIRSFETSSGELFIPRYIDILLWGVVTSNEPYDPKSTFSAYYK